VDPNRYILASLNGKLAAYATLIRLTGGPRADRISAF
jgi:hypothetical protein